VALRAIPEFSYQQVMNIGCEFHGEQKTHADAARIFYDARRSVKRSLINENPQQCVGLWKRPPKSCESDGEKSTRRTDCFVHSPRM